MDRWIDVNSSRCMDGSMDRIDGWMDGWVQYVDEWMYR